MILVGGQHADALNLNRQQDEFENDETGDNQNGDARQSEFRITPDQDDAKPAGQLRLLRQSGGLILRRHRLGFSAQFIRRATQI
jgi:hypothetical protein